MEKQEGLLQQAVKYEADLHYQLRQKRRELAEAQESYRKQVLEEDCERLEDKVWAMIYVIDKLRAGQAEADLDDDELQLLREARKHSIQYTLPQTLAGATPAGSLTP